MANAGTEGAAAAGTYFIAVMTHLFETRDEGPWHALVAEGCRTCTAMLEDARAGRDDGEDGVLEVVHSTAVELAPGSSYSATLIVREQRGDAATEASTPGTYRFYFALSYDQSWRVEALDVGPAEGS